jgi:peroxiredoxin
MQKSTVSFSSSKMWKYGLGIFSLLALLIVVGIFSWNPHPVLPAPDVTFTTIKGEKIALKSLHGKPVLLTFWATDCPSCVKEVNDFIDLYQQFHSQGLEIIAVAMYYDPPNHVVEMTQAKQIPYHVALDLRSEIAQAFSGVPFTPTTFLISPEGQVVFSKVGLFDLKAMQQRIQQLLQGKN